MKQLGQVRIIGAIVCVIVAIGQAAQAAAAEWAPRRPVAFIVGSAAGGGIDLTARLLQRLWDQRAMVKAPVVVINKPGAGNSVAWQYLNERGADGHAIAIGTANLVSNPAMKLTGYHDVTPLALLFDDYFILMVKADSPLKTIADVKQRLLADPGALAFGFGPGLGAGTHTAAAMTVKGMGADVKRARFVPYRNASEAVTGMLSGEIDIVSGTAVTAPAFIASGRVRALGVIAEKRLTGQLAAVPTVKEQGVDAVFINWRGVVGPKGMGKAQAAYWIDTLQRVGRTEEWQKELARNFWTENFKAGPDFERFLREQENVFRAIWAEIGTSS